MARKYNKVDVPVKLEQIVPVELTDEQLMKASAEIYVENPTAFLGQIVAYASVADMETKVEVDDGLGLLDV